MWHEEKGLTCPNLATEFLICSITCDLEHRLWVRKESDHIFSRESVSWLSKVHEYSVLCSQSIHLILLFVFHKSPAWTSAESPHFGLFNAEMFVGTSNNSFWETEKGFGAQHRRICLFCGRFKLMPSRHWGGCWDSWPFFFYPVYLCAREALKKWLLLHTSVSLASRWRWWDTATSHSVFWDQEAEIPCELCTVSVHAAINSAPGVWRGWWIYMDALDKHSLSTVSSETQNNQRQLDFFFFLKCCIFRRWFIFFSGILDTWIAPGSQQL